MSGDRCFFRLTGTATGALLVNDQLVRPEGDFTCYVIPRLVLEPQISVFANTERGLPSEFSDLLKFSGVRNVTIEELIIPSDELGPRENLIDMNNACSGIRILRGELGRSRQNALTIKGGGSDILVGGMLLHRGTGHCDVELGSHSDQIYRRTVGVSLPNWQVSDGSRLRVRVGYAKKPICTAGTQVQYQVFAGLAVEGYVIAKHYLPVIP